MTTNTPTPDSFPVDEAWKPLPRTHWSEEEAAHFLRRTGFSATPDAVKKVLRGSIQDAIDDSFSAKSEFKKSENILKFEAESQQRRRKIYRETKDPNEKRRLQRELRREDGENFNAFAMQWFDFARQPENSVREKFVLFLEDVFVVERPTVKETPVLFDLQQILRQGIELKYPDLCKQVSREPAMVRYLNLNENTAKKPNENFARELFELFTLGEGNYSEDDIKEAARAFTGYRVKNRHDFYREERQFDKGRKTIFGETGNWDGDDVIDITFKQPAARTYLIREFIKFYVSDTPPHEAFIEALGEQWAAHNFELRYLVDTIFQSRYFFHPAHRGNCVKSPIQFYLGLCQDLNLDIVPFESRLLRSMRAMGQSFYDPPNVRGWLYGQHWINSTTISARRQLVDYIFTPINEKRLNGNEKRALKKANAAGRGNFVVTDERLQQVLGKSPEDLAKHFTTYFITAPLRENYLGILKSLLGDTKQSQSTDRVRDALIALFQSPAYNLC